jgi:uncharacterized repeat protein (TIGR03806 family)
MIKFFALGLAAVLSLDILVNPAGAALINRWSFNNAAGAAPTGTVVTDSVSGANGVIVGNGATFTGPRLTLPGTTTGAQPPTAIAGYADLPNGLISSKANLTVEAWATIISTRNWQRLFDFGKMNIAGTGTGATTGEIKPDSTLTPNGTASTDDLMLAVNRGTTVNTQRQGTRSAGAAEISVDSGATITAGTEYHFVLVAQDNAGTFGTNGMQVRWYLNGVLVQTANINFHLRDIADVNNWLGRSQFTGDSQANISYNEFRLYDHAMTPPEISNSRNAGPDATFPPPSTQADSATINYNQKVRIPVLANDSNYVASTVVIATPPAFGTVTPDSAGRILYAHTNGTPGADSFTYQVSGAGGISAATTVTVNFTTNLRLTNSLLNVPSTPPATAYQLVNAFPSVSFTQPVCLRTPPGETNRLFVCQKGGLLRVIPNQAAPSASTFLDLPVLLTSRGEALSTENEQGLLGLAFHPGYATNGYFFVYYSVTNGGSVYERLSRFTVQAGNSNAANPASEVILFNQLDTAPNHNGGDVHFGPDGYLYVSLGDGGSQNNSQGHAQKIDDGFFAAIIRLDVDKRPGSLAPNLHSQVPLYSGAAAYAIPPNNPFIGATSFNGAVVNPNAVFTELFAVGFRNPWRFSFDLMTSNLWCADVGQNIYEEINIVTNGGNYGWAYREGAHPGFGTPPVGFTSTDPIYEYTHGSGNFQGNSVSGGFVYRGANIPSLYGRYIFADYVSGNVWAMTYSNSTPSVARITGLANLVAFAPDPANGDVLAADIAGGRIMRLTAGTAAGSYPTNLSDTGLFADVTTLSPAPGVLPYAPTLPFWSDYAIKTRWFTINDLTSKMAWSRDGLWTFPANQIWVKHFDLEMERGNPATKKRLETRLLVRSGSGVYGVSYQWNAAQTEATLVPDNGADFDLSITSDGTNYTQRWHIPTRAECLACHTPQGGHALSFTTRQMNRTNTIHGVTGNQLDVLNAAGYFTAPPDNTSTLPYHVTPTDASVPLETRARSYLDVNCAYCHRPGGPGGGPWDGRASTPLFQTGMINGSAANNGGDPANKLIVPLDPPHSIILNRVAAANGFTRMPPLGSSELDEANIALLTQWIQGWDTNRMPFSDWQLATLGSTNDPAGDPEGDGRNNYVEYLLGTPPLAVNANSDLSLAVLLDGTATVSYVLSPNAVAQVQTSTNLLDWSLWNVPGNSGRPQSSNPQTVQGVSTNNPAFFRLRLNER